MRSAFRVIRTVRENMPVLSAMPSCRHLHLRGPSSGYRRTGAAGPRADLEVCRAHPLYRQSEIYGRQGVELSRSPLSGWVDACCRLLSPLEEALHGYVLTDGKLHADDTPVPVLLPAIRKRRPGGYGPTFVTTVTPGQRWRRRCGSLTARTEKASIRRPILRGSVVYCRRMLSRTVQ